MLDIKLITNIELYVKLKDLMENSMYLVNTAGISKREINTMML